MSGFDAFLILLGIVVGVGWLAFKYLRAFSGERVGVVGAIGGDSNMGVRYPIAVRRTDRGPRAPLIVHVVMGMSALIPGTTLVMNQVEAIKAADALEAAAQEADQ